MWPSHPRPLLWICSMPNSSMNPRVSAPLNHAPSAHSLAIMRPLLRAIAVWHRERTRLVPIDPDIEFDDINVEDASEPKPPTRDDLDHALNGPYAAQPAASSMTRNEIAGAIKAGIDPSAEAIDGSPFLYKPPVAMLIVAARFAVALSDAAIVSQITAPRAVSLLAIPDRTERKAAWKNIEHVLQRLADLSDSDDDTWRGFKTPVCTKYSHASASRSFAQKDDYETSITEAVSSGYKILALVPDAKSMSPTIRAVCSAVLDWPPLSGKMIVEILRATHTATGALSENALRDILPSDDDIASLPLAVIEGAFLETTTIKVAKAIATASARSRTLPPAATTLDDIVLCEDARAPVSRLVADIDSWKAGQLDWREVSSSVLFYGPPGNGKTLLASAIAGSLNIPLVATSYPDCQRHGHQGDMLKALSEKVDEAVRAAPSVFFLDELDAFTHRNRPNRRSDYIVGVVNGLLEHLSRLNDAPGVIVLGATNFPDMIDPAVIRPGRFDLKIELSNPGRTAVLRILKRALGEDAETLTLHPITDQLLGASGAQVTAFVREARGLARAARMPLQQSHLAAAAARICPALEADLLWRVAVHEAGHIVVGHRLGIPAPRKAAITGFGGFVSAHDVPLHTLDTALDQIAVLLAGHAAERTFLDGPSNGAGLGMNSDLSRATELAANLAFEWGLGDRLSHIQCGTGMQYRPGDYYDTHIEAVLKKQHDRVAQIIENSRVALERVAKALITHRELGQNDITALLGSTDDGPTALSATTLGNDDA